VREFREATEEAHSRLAAYANSALLNSDAVPPRYQIVFVESDGDGRPASGTVIDARNATSPHSLSANAD